MSVNKAIVVGNLGADPELRYTQNGTAVCNFRIATNEKWKDKQGQLQERTTWFKVTVWGSQGENCEKYLTKGRQVYVEGRIQTDQYTDKDGVERYTWELVAQNVTFLSGGSASPGNGGGGERRTPPAEDDWQEEFEDDHIPF